MWKWFVTALDNTGDFEGRARRKEFWSFVAGLFVLFLLSLAAGIFQVYFTGWEFWPVITIGFTFTVMIVPGLAATVRRLHDTNRTGWFIMLPFVPFGIFLLLYYLMSEGTHGENRYGPDPKEADLDETLLLEAPIEDEMILEDWREWEPFDGEEEEEEDQDI